MQIAEQMNAQMQVQDAQTVELDISKDPLPEAVQNNESYKLKLRALPEVQQLTNELDVQDVNSILRFGQKPSEEISKVSDKLLAQTKGVNANECSEMLSQLTKIMDKFDIKEIEEPDKAPGMFDKIFNKMKNNIDKLFEKYDNMGKEVDKIYVILNKYSNDLHKSNDDLKELYDALVTYFETLEKYVVACEIGLEEINAYKTQVQNDVNTDPQKKQMIIDQLDQAYTMLDQRRYDLLMAETVAMQTCPMIKTMEMSNFNLQRKIQSSFIVTLPIFKNCLIQAITLKKQQVVAKSMQDLDDKTNELLIRNAQGTAQASVQISKMASSSSVNIETVKSRYEIIKQGIEDTRAIDEQMARERKENTATLEKLQADMRSQRLI